MHMNGFSWNVPKWFYFFPRLWARAIRNLRNFLDAILHLKRDRHNLNTVLGPGEWCRSVISSAWSGLLDLMAFAEKNCIP